jgi:hypothetical protein
LALERRKNKHLTDTGAHVLRVCVVLKEESNNRLMQCIEILYPHVSQKIRHFLLDAVFFQDLEIWRFNKKKFLHVHRV